MSVGSRHPAVVNGSIWPVGGSDTLLADESQLQDEERACNSSEA